MIGLAHIGAGIRYGASSLRRKLAGWRRFEGSARDICIDIVRACWNGRYLANSLGGYHEFWARDLGICADALLELGFGAELLSTLDYAFARYAKAGRITTTISPGGVCFSFPNAPSPDSLALLLRTLRLAGAHELVRKHQVLLEEEARRLVVAVVDPATGLVRPGVHCSGMRDYSVRESSCYDNTMLAVLQRELGLLKLRNPLSHFEYARQLKDAFWLGEHFSCDMASKHVTADANVMPFWTGAVTDPVMLQKSLSAIAQAGLADGIPLSYIGGQVKERMLGLEFLVPKWERDAHWSNIGLLYLKLLQGVDKAAADKHIAAYAQLVERDGTLFECYQPATLNPYRSWAYLAADGMLWAANLAVMLT